ncbi:hypothetical protein DZK27_02315 [Rhodobacteraceae bacterium 63075]|nr:hypothetical protein DZK27_02315 [Rhodobacteraceae bacterium 63075]
MKRAKLKLIAASFLVLASMSAVSAENMKFNFYSGSNFVGGVPVTDTRSGRCYSGSKERLGEYCGMTIYMCSNSADKFASLLGQANRIEIISQDRPGFPVLCK